ncbi:hypothetical protein Ctob_004629 [Chrysochromulina tobinii]|uniref:Uncharacterized protein n=1 Tax=Chrysochromulina tobinii TaxID=1460289 RepID=A0A0M0JXK3_9EUKA|nr:hypothetical protein Ctob_004629 [Chrysochromulina tobinii]|eukprot:KOO31012.1 hypothetical protein Ctob_004629 [Chrysochromulina sp. CCMP291]
MAALASALGVAASPVRLTCEDILPARLIKLAGSGDREGVASWLSDCGGHIDATYNRRDGTVHGLTMLMAASIGGHVDM